nr:MAG TPA: hypothetical protein [Caudoviricetes sp.]
MYEVDYPFRKIKALTAIRIHKVAYKYIDTDYLVIVLLLS